MTYADEKGVTLVELMIALALGGMVLGALYMIVSTQQRSYIMQEEVVEMQQEQRVALEIMSREIRNAGYTPVEIDPSAVGTGCGDVADPDGNPRIIAAGPFRINFSMDLSADGDCNTAGVAPYDESENVTFRFADAGDAGGDGIADAGADDIGRDTGANPQPLASNVHAIGFAYAYDSNGDGILEVDVANRTIWAVPNAAGNAWLSLDIDNNGLIDENDTPPASFGMADATLRGQIRAVRIWLLVRASRPDQSFLNTERYKVGVNLINLNPNPHPLTGAVGTPDNFRRRLLSISVRCRNLGLLD